jgi:hypothetical protein
VTESTIHRGIVILSPRLTISEVDLQRFREAGYIPIIGNPKYLKIVAPHVELDGNMVTMAALQTLANNDTRQRDFGKLILDSLIAEADPKP